VNLIMAVDESEDMDVIISQKDLDREQAKLVQLKGIADQKKKLIGKGSSGADRVEAREAQAEAKKQAKLVKKMNTKLMKGVYLLQFSKYT